MLLLPSAFLSQTFSSVGRITRVVGVEGVVGRGDGGQVRREEAQVWLRLVDVLLLQT